MEPTNLPRERGLNLVTEIEALGQRWHDWQQSERQWNQAVDLLCGGADPRRAPALPVSREEFTIAGEIMLCLHPACGGFVRGPIDHGAHVAWTPQPECPRCGQRYLLRDP